MCNQPMTVEAEVPTSVTSLEAHLMFSIDSFFMFEEIPSESEPVVFVYYVFGVSFPNWNRVCEGAIPGGRFPKQCLSICRVSEESLWAFDTPSMS